MATPAMTNHSSRKLRLRFPAPTARCEHTSFGGGVCLHTVPSPHWFCWVSSVFGLGPYCGARHLKLTYFFVIVTLYGFPFYFLTSLLKPCGSYHRTTATDTQSQFVMLTGTVRNGIDGGQYTAAFLQPKRVATAKRSSLPNQISNNSDRLGTLSSTCSFASRPPSHFAFSCLLFGTRTCRVPAVSLVVAGPALFGAIARRTCRVAALRLF